MTRESFGSLGRWDWNAQAYFRRPSLVQQLGAVHQSS